VVEELAILLVHQNFKETNCLKQWGEERTREERRKPLEKYHFRSKNTSIYAREIFTLTC